MNQPIVSSHEPVILLGGVQPAPTDLSDALKFGQSVVCADGGADHALAAGLAAVAVIGDMDSISARARAAFSQVLHPIAEQDSTDFDKALRHISAPLVLGVGFSGARLDHELGSMSVLARHPERRCILIGRETVVTLCPPQVRLDLPEGLPVSLYPLAEVGVRSAGLRWPTQGLRFAPDGQIGTLNAATGPEAGAVELTPDAPKMLLIMPREALDTLVAAVLGAGSAWPARAG